MSFVLNLSQIAALVDGRITRGDSVSSFSGIASLDQACSSDVSFLGNEKYAAQFRETKAGCVLVTSAVTDAPEGVALIEVENPSFAFSKIVEKATEFLRKPKAFGIHPRAFVAEDVTINPEKCRVAAGAVIESGAVIGDGCEIGANVSIGEGVVMGVDCKIYQNVSIRERCVLGDRVILQPGAVIGSDGYGYEMVGGKHVKIDQIGIVVLENDVEIGANTAIDRARFGRTLIGEGTKIDNLVQIAHNVQIGKHCLIISQTGIAGSAKLGNYVIVAAQAGVAGHIVIADQVILSGRSGATKDIATKGTYSGMPTLPVLETNRQKALIKKLPKLLVDIKELKKKLES